MSCALLFAIIFSDRHDGDEAFMKNARCKPKCGGALICATNAPFSAVALPKTGLSLRSGDPYFRIYSATTTVITPQE